MKKKALLIFASALIAFLVLLPGASSVSADGYPHYYAYGKYPSKKAGVYGHNYVYDNDVYSYFVAEFVNVNLSLDPHTYIEVGWIKGFDPYPQEATFYVGWEFPPEPFDIDYFGDAQYNTEHDYKIYEPDYTWLVKIDGEQVKSFEDLEWSEGYIQAVSESVDSASPPVNELEGHFWDLRYYSGSGWPLWDDIDTDADPPYRVEEVDSDEFYTDGPIEVGADFTADSGITLDFPETNTAYPTQGYPGETEFKFTDETTGGTPPYTYEWDFDTDGTTDSTSQDPSYTYPDIGTYTVSLTVTDSLGGSDTETKEDYLMVYEPGDANADGKVNCTDITRLERIVLLLDPPTIWADANKDRKINCGDITKIERIMLGIDC